MSSPNTAWLSFREDGTLQTRNRRGIQRDWLRGVAFEHGLRRLGEVLAILRRWPWTVAGWPRPTRRLGRAWLESPDGR